MPTAALPVVTPSARRLYAGRSALYQALIWLLRYPQGLTRFFAESDLLRPGLKVLDAGCGTGAVTRAVRAGLTKRGLLPAHFDGFDLTPQMLNRFWRSLERRPIPGIELVVADVLQLGALPASWRDYDLIVSSAMLEYLPKAALSAALEGLRLRLRPGGTLVVFISRRSLLMVPLISRWWHANLYGRAELRAAFREAGFAEVEFLAFPCPYGYLNGWGHVVSASC